MNWLCRFYRGVHSGVEVTLPQGRCVIGSDPLQADMVLVDEGIAPSHLVLQVDEQGVRLLEASTELLQEGKGVAIGDYLQAGLRLEAGSLLWSFCAEGQTLPAVLNEPTRVVAPVTTPRRSCAGLLLGIASLAVLALLVGLLGMGWWQENEGREQLAEQEVRRLLKQPAYEGVSLARTEGGSWLLSGYIKDNRQRLALQEMIERHALVARLELRSMEEIRQGAEFILQRQGLGAIKVTAGKEGGWLRLTGALAQESDAFTGVEELLRREVPGLLGIENRVNVAGSHRKRLDTLLEEHGLKQLAVRERGDRIELRGDLDEAQLILFTQLQQAFRREFGARPQLELVGIGSKSRQDDLTFEVKAISLGKVPYVVLANNQRYPVGAATGDGIRILAIRRDAVVVRKGQQEFVIRVGGGLAHDSFGGATAQR